MRLGWHKWWLLAAVFTACSLDPQPQIPGDRVSGAGGSSTVGTGDGTAGTTLTVGNGGGGTDINSGSDAGTAPQGPDAGGEGGSAGEAGAANEAGAAGSPAR